jgi:diguanylate cyclase (GGDEF)-like protein
MQPHKEIECLDDFVKLSFFADLGIGIAASKAINEAMLQVMDKIGGIYDPMTWSLMLVDKEKKEFFFKFVSGRNADKLEGKRTPLLQGIPGWVLENRAATSSHDTSQDKRFSKKIESILGFTVQSVLAAPLKVEEDIIGVLYLINRKNDERFSDGDTKILADISDFAAITVEKVYYLSALKDMSNIDPLTGVYNRRSFENQLLKESERCRRYGHQVSLLLVDIDKLKDINHRLGHHVGDDVLKDFTRVMRKNTRRIDMLGRYADDQFAILLPHTKKHEGEVVRQRILKDIKQENKRGKEIPYTVSIGLHAVGPEKVDDLVEMTAKDLVKQQEERAG